MITTLEIKEAISNLKRLIYFICITLSCCLMSLVTYFFSYSSMSSVVFSGLAVIFILIARIDKTYDLLSLLYLYETELRINKAIEASNLECKKNGND